MNLVTIKYQLLSVVSVCLLLASCTTDDENKISREDYIGNYQNNEKCGVSENDYTISISASTQEDEIFIDNFYGVGVAITAFVAEDSITIDPQMITTFGLNQTFEGSGALAGDVLRLYYSVETPGVDIDDCIAVATKE